MKMTSVFLSLIFLWMLPSCRTDARKEKAILFSRDNLIAWCIVPFDSLQRTPEERATMLNELGIKQLAYDWRTKHIPSFEKEIETLEKHNIQLAAVWLWIAPDSTGLLGRDNEEVIEIVRKNHVQTDFWVGFDSRYFENLTDDQKLEKASSAVRSIHATLNKMGCKMNLYNHGDWFGEPTNEISVLEKTGLKDVGIVYNFHHAHQQVKDFPALLSKMLPYLHAVNINGMRVGGPKILPLGAGDQELGMMKILQESGYHGPIGILGHVENKDVRVVLEGNLNGLKSLLKTMGDEKALKTYE